MCVPDSAVLHKKYPSFSPTIFVCGHSFILKNNVFTKKLRKERRAYQ